MRVPRPIAAALIGALALAGCSSDEPEDTSAFCNAMRSATAATSAVADLDFDDPDAIDAVVADLTSLTDTAPEPIVDEVTHVAEVYETIIRGLAGAARPARSDLLREFQPQLDEVGPDAVEMQDFAQRECGIRFSGPAEPTPTPEPLDIED